MDDNIGTFCVKAGKISYDFTSTYMTTFPPV